MTFSSKFFQNIDFSSKQISQFFANADKDLKIAENSKNPDVIFRFCYSSIIKLGIAVISEKGLKIRSMPGHHVKILDVIGETFDLSNEINYLHRIRRKRNTDLYEGGASHTKKETNDLLEITKNIFRKIQKTSKKGFTLVELIVSLTIAGILMLGLSTFFSSTFHNIFKVQGETATTQRQFAVNEIIRNKFTDIKEIIDIEEDEYIFFQNEVSEKQLPFSYIGTTEIDREDHLVFKDIMIFNKIIYDSGKYYYGDSGSGDIKEIDKYTVASPPINFAGFAKKDDDYYIALPLENKIIKCIQASCGDSEINTKLSNPTDLEVGGDFLFISDSENNRIIRKNIISGDETPLIENLNYPTGLAYYEKDDDKYLFVADSFSHEIKRIKLSDTGTSLAVETVIGAGDNESCNNTAKFCKLHLPTGLFADDAEHILYIADSGNNRILKMSDPPTSDDLTDFTIDFDLESESKISKIEFIFPKGSTLTDVSETEEKFNDLHAGKYEINGNTLTYKLSVPIVESYLNNHECQCGGTPEVCQKCLDSFAVLEEKNIFTNGDLIVFEGDSQNYQVAVDTSTTPDTINITPNNVETIAYSPGTIAKVNKEFSAINYEFHFDLSNSVFPESFQNIKIKIYNENNDLIQEEVQVMRIGNDTLGTPEDIIAVIESGDTVNFPTGVTDAYYANSETNKIIEIGGGVKNTFEAISLPSISTFDYISDFTLSAEDPVKFTKYNCTGDDCKILELELKTDTQTYKLNASLK